VKSTLFRLEIAATEEILKHVMPVLVLDDGLIFIHEALTGLLILWDPSDPLFDHFITFFEDRPLDLIGVYTGSLLSLQ
jgi:hypothetical protein